MDEEANQLSGENTKRVAMVGALWHISVSPSVINSVRMWIRNNYVVDFIAIDTQPEISFQTRFQDEKLNVYVRNNQPVRIGIPLLGGALAMLSLVAFSLRCCKGKKYDCIIGYDPLALSIATALRIFLAAPVIYHSLELYIPGRDWSWRRRLTKMLERWCNRKASYSIIQDEVRAKCLIEENRIDKSKVLIVPNSFLQDAKTEKNDYLRARFGIGRDKKIVLHIGGMVRYNMVEELIESVPEWHNDCILVLHGWVWQSDIKNDYLNLLKEMAQRSGLYDTQIFFSTEFLSQEALDKMVSSADVGVALYHNVDLNFFNMASGKLLQYLKCGLPVVTMDFPNLKEIVEGNRCGVCINDKSEIANGIKEVLSHYDEFGDNAYKCFQDKYEYSRHYQKVIGKIIELRGRR